LIELIDESTPTMLNKIYMVWIIKLGYKYMMKLGWNNAFLVELCRFSYVNCSDKIKWKDWVPSSPFSLRENHFALFEVLSDWISFNQENFRLGKTHSRFSLKEVKKLSFIFLFEKLVYFCLFFWSLNFKFKYSSTF